MVLCCLDIDEKLVSHMQHNISLYMILIKYQLLFSQARQSVKTLYGHIKKNTLDDDQVVWLTISSLNLIITPREKVAMM